MAVSYENLRRCERCGTPLNPNRGPRARVCVRGRCKARPSRGTSRATWVNALKIGSGCVGAIGELLVAADLTAKGCAVFRAVSPHSPCDLIAMRDGKCYRIEVRTGFFLINGSLSYSQKGLERTDVCAVVIHDEKAHEIRYLPGPP